MKLIWKNYSDNNAVEINQWLKHEETNKFLEIDDWHSAYVNIITGVDFYYENGEKSYYKLNYDYFCKVVIENNRLISVLNLYVNYADNSIQINPIIVAPILQGRGYGTAIIKELIGNPQNILRSNCYSKIGIMIESDNLLSLRCFEKSGFNYVRDCDNGIFKIYEYEFK